MAAWYKGSRIDNFGVYPDPVGPYPKPDSNFTSLSPDTPLTVPPGGAGTVSGVRAQPWGPAEYSVTVKMDVPYNNVATHYALNYVSNPQVHVGQHVVVGQVLAYPGNVYNIGTAFAFTDSDLYGQGDANEPFSGTYINPLLNPVPYLDNIAKGGNGVSSNGTSGQTVNITLKEFLQSALNQLRNNAGVTNTLGAGPSQNIINFMISWAHHEGGSQTNACSFNVLNTMQDEPGATQCPGTLPGIKAYPDDTTGEKAITDALNNGLYSSLVHALVTNDEINLGFTQRGAPSFAHMMAANIAGDLSMWVNGRRSPLAESYILAIMSGAGISNANIEGGTMEGGPGTSQSTIDQWGQTVIGTGTLQDNNPLDAIGAALANVNNFFGMVGNFFSNPTRILKILIGSILLIAGIALLIKQFIPSSVKNTAKAVAGV